MKNDEIYLGEPQAMFCPHHVLTDIAYCPECTTRVA